jgi:hypothetical protein
MHVSLMTVMCNDRAMYHLACIVPVKGGFLFTLMGGV